MPHPVKVTITSVKRNHVFGTLTPLAYEVSCNAPGVAALQIPYAQRVGTFPAVPEGSWTFSAQLRHADGTALGALVTGLLSVPPDDIAIDEPLSLGLEVSRAAS